MRNDGSVYAHPKPLAQARVQLRRAYKSRSRKGKGSAHWRKQVAAVARLHACMAAWRSACASKATAALVACADSIRGATLNMAGLARNGSAEFICPWEYKAA